MTMSIANKYWSKVKLHTSDWTLTAGISSWASKRGVNFTPNLLIFVFLIRHFLLSVSLICWTSFIANWIRSGRIYINFVEITCNVTTNFIYNYWLTLVEMTFFCFHSCLAWSCFCSALSLRIPAGFTFMEISRKRKTQWQAGCT